MTLLDLFLYILAFGAIWLGSGFTVKSIEMISKKLKANTFIVSFVVLGLFTSLPETFLAINSTTQGTPEVSAGNLFGGIIVLFLLLIPLIAVTGKGAKIIKDIGKLRLFFSLVVIALPSIFFIDSNAGILEGLIFLLTYTALIFFIERNNSKSKKVDTKNSPIEKIKKNGAVLSISLGKLVLGIILIFISTNIILQNTIKLGEVLNISPFIVSLFIISIGTNLPEFSVGIRSIIQHDKNVALGNYIGSAAANTLLFGFLVLINPAGVTLNDPKIILTLSLLIVALILFYIFTVSKKILSPKEGFVLLSLYAIFCFIEIAGATGRF